MGVKKATFQSAGKISQHSLPGAYSRVDYVRNASGLVSVNNAVIFGDSRGGQPNKILWFENPSEAEDTLISGALLDAVKQAFNPGGDLTPQRIGAWRVNPGTQSSYEDQASAETVIDITSIIYGTPANQIKKKQEAGTVSGKKITIQYKGEDPEVFDNVEKESFEIQYTGSGTAAEMTINLTQLSIDVTGEDTDDLTLTFAEFPTIQEMVDYINSQENYTCTIKTLTPNDPSDELDSVSAQDVKTSAYTANSDLQAVIDAYNDSSWVTAAANSSLTSRVTPDNNTAYVYLSGAVHGSYTTDEWEDSLAIAINKDIQFVGSSSEEAGVHALIKSHCVAANSVTGKAERQFIVGGAWGESEDEVKARAKALNSDAGMIAYPGFKNYDLDNVTKLRNYSPAYYAAKLIGMQVCLALNEPATNKDVDVLEWETELGITEAEGLIENGVCCGYVNKSGRFVTARTVTTYQGSDLQRNEFSMMRESLFAARDLRTAVEESFVGHGMSNTMLGKVDAVVIGKLSDYLDLGIFNGNPAYWGYKKKVNGDIISIDYDANLTPPTNFIFVTSHMHVYASTTT